MISSTTTRRIKHTCLAALALVVAGCTEPNANSGDITIPQEAVERLGHLTDEQLFVKAGPKAFIAAFDRYCINNVNDPAKITALLRNDGYIAIARVNSGVTAYAHADGKPIVGLGRRAGSPDMCMIMSRRNSALKPAVNDYVSRIDNLFDISGISADADQTWVVQQRIPLVFLTFIDNDPNLGPLYAFAVAKDN